MPTIIDSLIVELGLDPSKFNEGQKQAAATAALLKDSLNKSGKEIQETSKHTSEGLSQLQGRILGLFAAFTAGKGLESFVKDITNSNAAAGRFAKILDLSVEKLSTLQGAARLGGGSVEGMSGTLLHLTDEMERFTLTGEAGIIPYLRTLQVGLIDSNGHLKTADVLLRDLTASIERQHLDPARAATLLRMIGVDPGSINMMLLGTKAYDELIKRQKELGVVTKEDFEQSVKLQRGWLELETASTSMGRSLLTWASPALIAVENGLVKLTEWSKSHQPFVKAAFLGLAGAATALGIAFLLPSAEALLLTAVVVGAGIAVAALYDDWKVFTEGGVSAFGDLWKYVDEGWKEMKGPVLATLDAMEKALGAMVATGASALKLLVDIFSGTDDEIGDDWDDMVDKLGDALMRLADIGYAIGSKIIAGIWRGFTGGGIINKIISLNEWITGQDLTWEREFLGINKPEDQARSFRSSGAVRSGDAVYNKDNGALVGYASGNRNGANIEVFSNADGTGDRQIVQRENVNVERGNAPMGGSHPAVRGVRQTAAMESIQNLRSGAAAQISGDTRTDNSRSDSNTTTVETNINGGIHITAPGGDVEAIGRGVGGAIKRNMDDAARAAHANRSLR